MVKDDVGDTDHYCLCMLEFECMSNEYATRDNEARKKKKNHQWDFGNRLFLMCIEILGHGSTSFMLWFPHLIRQIQLIFNITITYASHIS
jgi:hypothetical protein